MKLMKKRLSLFVMAFLAVLGVQAQMIAYSVSTNVVGEPGTSTLIDLQGTTGKDLSGVVFDADGNIEFNSAENLTGFPIGFEFRYNSQKMTHFLIGGDGEIQLSPTQAISTDVHKNKSSWFTNSKIHDVIGISPRQGMYGLEDTQISYWLEGIEGTRALCIEYKNVDFQGTFNAANDYCGAKATILYRLYEKSGNIEMTLKGFKPANTGSNNFFRIGILGDSNDFVEVQAWDGSKYSARDNNISYSPDSYPQDGIVYTFVAPEPCVTPFVAPTDLVLTSTTTQISGTFTVAQGDHFLVLVTTEETLSERPAAGTKYAVGDEIGNAKVIANVDRGEFISPNNMTIEQGTYNVFVIAYNMLCMDGPLYCAEAAKATIAMKPGAPAALTLSDVDKNTISVSATSSGANIMIAMTDEPGRNPSNQLMPYGAFGTPAGNYNVGDEIEGGGKVVYVGGTTEAPVVLNELVAGKPYFFRAWSTDGNGGYSSVYLDAIAATAAELPWEFDLSGAPIGEPPYGWTQDASENGVWSMNERAGYFYNQVNFASESEPTECWWQTSDIYLGENSNWLSIDIAATEIPIRFATDWTMKEGDVVAVQVTTDGVEYKDILKLDKDNMPDSNTDEETGETTTLWKNGQFHSFKANFSEYAGQKVKVRLYVKRQSKGQVQFKNFKIDGTLYGIVGTIPGLTWDNDLFMTQSADNKNVYTATMDVTIDEVPAEAYEYKLRANQNWDGYQLPASGNQQWMPAETGTFSLNFIADIAANTLDLKVLSPYEVSFDNKGNWGTVYAYTFSYDGENVIEYSGAWPGTEVPVSGGFFNRSWTYSFAAEGQPQFIIWSNGLSGDDAEQTDDLPFVNGKKYSYYPEITSVKISGSWNGWDGPEMEYIEYSDNAYQTTINLKEYTDDQEFKLVVNGQWIGSGELTAIEGGAADAVTQGDAGSNLKLKAGTGYDIVAFWQQPGKNVKEGWLLEITENTTVGVDGVRANAPQRKVYNLRGQRLDNTQRGVNIINNKKVVVK